MLTHDFFVIAITSPDEIPDEAQRIASLLRNSEADIVHIRKPGWSEEKTAELLRQIPEEFHCKLKLHDNFNLLKSFRLGGVHLNSRNPVPPPEAESVSCSFHSVEQLDACGHYNYVTLSPIYDSISKEGYRSKFDLKELKPFISGKNVIALGGVTPGKLHELKDAGFAGAAMLGHFWLLQRK